MGLYNLRFSVVGWEMLGHKHQFRGSLAELLEFISYDKYYQGYDLINIQYIPRTEGVLRSD